MFADTKVKHKVLQKIHLQPEALELHFDELNSMTNMRDSDMSIHLAH